MEAVCNSDTPGEVFLEGTVIQSHLPKPLPFTGARPHTILGVESLFFSAPGLFPLYFNKGKNNLAIILLEIEQGKQSELETATTSLVPVLEMYSRS